MSDKQYFHFTLGPVQSFVAQARRTRDFWAGSFILSWLSGVAMQEVIAQCGNNNRNAIKLPIAEPEFLDWLTNTNKDKRSDKPPAQGSIPNRFKAEIGPDVQFKPELVSKAVADAWSALAEVVYQRDLAKLDINNLSTTRKIWERQIKNCWEIVWAVTDKEEDSAILDQSKNWRAYAPPEEPGVKCMMMDGWQELSGVERPSAKKLSEFWGILREGKLIASVEKADEKNYLRAIASDMRPSEYLCAIAFVKRRFPRYFKEVRAVEMPSGWKLYGWDVGSGRPSVAYMAAVPWLENIIKQANHSDQMEELMKSFHGAAYTLTKEYGEWSSDIECIRNAMMGKHRDKNDRKWKALNGEVFFESELENANKFPGEIKRKQAGETLTKLKALQRNVRSKAAPFYAVLMMDGDSLGNQISDAKKQDAISNGLQAFTHKVSDIVQEHNGFLVYAGGDDVLAVLPINTALNCALAVRECYEAIFAEDKNGGLKLSASISAAIEFAHIQMPLTKVLRDAHSLLDEVAKEHCGRDSLAVRVWKPGGKALEWAMPWDKACEKIDGKQQLVIERLRQSLDRDDPQHQFSNGFFYKLRERLGLFNPPNGVKDVDVISSLTKKEAVKLMAAEYVNSGLFNPEIDRKDKALQLEHAVEVVGPLLEQCYPMCRALPEWDGVSEERPKAECFSPRKSYHADGALLVRFLVHKGVL